MKKLFLKTIVAVAVLLIAVIGFVFLRSNAIINKKYNVALVDVTLPDDAASKAAGKKIALTRGCYGCHNKDLSGNYFPYWETGMVAANISQKIPLYSDPELFRLLRHGVKRDGTGLWSMPVGMFTNLTDNDILKLMAHLRTIPPVKKEWQQAAFNMKGRLKIISGEIVSEVSLARKAVKPFTLPDTPTEVQKGNYLVLTTCTECHGYDLKGAYGSPPMIIAKAYNQAQFITFMQTGKALGNRELAMMSDMCRDRFVHYSEDEIKAIYNFLTQMDK
jgi:cytochrome c553